MAGGSSNPSGQIANVTPPSNSASPSVTKSSDAVTFFVKDDGGRMQPVRVPLVDASTLDKELGVSFKPASGRCPQSTERQRIRGSIEASVRTALVEKTAGR